MQEWTIQKLLNWVTGYLSQKGVDSPRLSAELLLGSVLSLQRIELYTLYDRPVLQADLDKLHELVKRAGEHEPVAYLIGKTEFYSLELEISRSCLIPRPETELLVERAVAFLRRRGGRRFVCDLCTGSGCVAVAIGRNYSQAQITATDISDEALQAAAKNVDRYELGARIELLCGDLFEPVVPELKESKFDLVVCNPPYVSAAEYEKLDRNVKEYEPKVALFGGDDGLELCRKVIAQAGGFLKTGGALMLEIAYNRGRSVLQLLEAAGGFDEIVVEKDFSGHDRVVTAKRVSTE